MRFLYAGTGLIIFWVVMAKMLTTEEIAVFSNEAFWIASAIVIAGGLAGGD